MQMGNATFIHLDAGDTSGDAALDTALVGATADTEDTVLTPILVPGVDNGPVLDTLLNTPADETDGVATEVRATSVDVNTRLVVLEVRVDGEGGLDGAVLHEVLLDSRLATEGVARLEEELVLVVGGGVGGLGVAGLLARRGIEGHGRALGVLADAVVVAEGHGVAHAELVVLVVTTSDDTGVGEVRPSRGGVTTLAAITARTAARKEVASRELRLLLATSGNAPTVSGSTDGGNSPARTAGRLVPDAASDGRARREVSADIEGFRDIVGFGVLLEGEEGATLEGTAELAGVLGSLVEEVGVQGSNPGGVRVGVNLLDEADALEVGLLENRDIVKGKKQADFGEEYILEL